MDREANNGAAWHGAFPQASMIDRELPLAHEGNWNDWTKAPSVAGNYRPTPRQAAAPDTLHRAGNFLQENFLLLFPISLFLLFGIFAAVMVASP
jgi:hypothetical protein